MNFEQRPRFLSGKMGPVALVGLLIWPQLLSAHNNNYPFDYDPARAPDPGRTANDLQDLHDNLPGLPEGLVEIEMDGIAFNYYPETLDMIQRARDSGPAIQPPIDRTPHRCATHAIYSPPSILIQPASSACQAAGQEVYAAFDGANKACQEVEYPEVFVFDHPPAVVDANFLGRSELLSTVEGHIALIGEALSHLEYPVGLIPESFWPVARNVIAKIRYDKLSQNLDAQLTAYDQAVARLQSSASCFDATGNSDMQAAIGALSNEMIAVKQHLDQLYTDGLAQAAQDRLAVENQGRLRNDLLHPSLTDHEREMLAFYLTAVYWRMRGGGLIRNPANGTIPDIAYVVNLFDLIEQFTAGLYLEGLDSLGYRYAIDESAGYQEWWDMGNEDDDQFTDLLWMTDRGRRGVIRPGNVLRDLGFDTKHMVAGGTIMGPCYYYMWYELWSRNGRMFQLGEDLVTPYFVFLEMPVSTGEACYGGAMGIGLARTLLWGRPDTTCQPQCSGRNCGTDGCGGSCGTCSGSASCSEAGQCVQPGSDSGVTLPDAAAGPDTAQGNTDAGVVDATTVTSDAAFADTAVTTNDRGGSSPDTTVASDAATEDSTSDRSPAVSHDVETQGCESCAAQDTSSSASSALILVGLLIANRLRRRQ